MAQMKVNLVVANAGPNQGKMIPIVGAKFLIGRDPHCNLRPASQAISKQHCAILLRSGSVYIQDLSSMNGTILNGLPVQEETLVNDGDLLRVGPLEFRFQVVSQATPVDGTPLPDKLKPLSNTAIQKTGLESIPTQSKPAATAEKIGGKPDAETDAAAAMLLGMDDDTPSGEAPSIPGGSTVMEVPAVDASGRPIQPKKDEKKDAAESSSAANELLKKYFRRSG